MFGTYEKFNLKRVPFARQGSWFSVYEDFSTTALLLTVARVNVYLSARQNVFVLELTRGGESLPYTYSCDMAALRMECEGGWAEITLTEGDQLRVRGQGAALRMRLCSVQPPADSRACTGVLPMADGCVETVLGRWGKLLYVPLAGSLTVDAPPAGPGRFGRLELTLLPDCTTGRFEAAVHQYDGLRQRDGEYPPFEELAEASRASFEDFIKVYPPAAPGFEETARYAKYVIWSNRALPSGKLTETVIYMHRLWLCAGFSWQQGYNAMAMLGDTAEAWREICAMFAYQHPSGMLPGTVDPYNHNFQHCQPAFQGLALDFVTSQAGDGFLTPQECLRMYPKLRSWLDYWLEQRNAGLGDDRVNVLCANESGWDDASIFAKGFPTRTPDLYAFIILLMESVARLALGCGMTEEADSLMARSRALTARLIDELWDGEKFICRVTGSEEIVESLSLACFQPLILGRRLPQEIIDKLAERVMRPDFLTDIGLVSESTDSPLCRFGFHFVLGRVVAPANMLISVGLKLCGKEEEAREVARRFCENIRDKGIILGFAPYDVEPATGEPVTGYPLPTAADPWPWSGWSACCFLIMSQYVLGE